MAQNETAGPNFTTVPTKGFSHMAENATEGLNVTATKLSPLLKNSFLSWASHVLHITDAALLIFVLVLIFLGILLLLISLICCCLACCRKIQKKKRQYVKMPTVYKDQLPGFGDDGETVGALEYSLEYISKTSTLKVGILQASDLITPPGSGPIDPYVKVSIQGVPSLGKPKSKKSVKKISHVTDIQWDTTCPIFNSAFDFYVPYADLKTAILQMLVYDSDEPNQPVLIGGLKVQLYSLPLENYAGKTYESTGYLRKTADFVEQTGQLCVVLTYDPDEAVLSVNVLEAKNLDLPEFYRKHPPETMVSVTLHTGKKKFANKKTHIRSETLDPYFGETLKFPVVKQKLIVASLTLKVKYRGQVFKNAGKVILGPDALQASGRQQWREMLANPKRPAGMWQILSSPEK